MQWTQIRDSVESQGADVSSMELQGDDLVLHVSGPIRPEYIEARDLTLAVTVSSREGAELELIFSCEE